MLERGTGARAVRSQQGPVGLGAPGGLHKTLLTADLPFQAPSRQWAQDIPWGLWHRSRSSVRFGVGGEGGESRQGLEHSLELREILGRMESKQQRGMKGRIKMKASIEGCGVADRLFLLPSLSIISRLFVPFLLHPTPPSQADSLIESERVYAKF